MRVIFDSVRSSNERKSTRDRQCFKCLGKINKGEKYKSHQFRYDKTIITAHFHIGCFNNEKSLNTILMEREQDAINLIVNNN